MSEWRDEYKPKVRKFMEEEGRPVLWDDHYGDGEDRYPSMYGWVDYTMARHVEVEGCAWMVTPGCRMVEETFSQFDGTGNPNAREVGVNVSGAECLCGKYKDVTLRWDGSVSDMLTAILGLKPPKTGWTL